MEKMSWMPPAFEELAQAGDAANTSGSCYCDADFDYCTSSI